MRFDFNHLARGIILTLCIAAPTSHARALSTSEDYQMEFFISSVGGTTFDPQGMEMFVSAAGPDFAFGVDSGPVHSFPFPTESFTLPVAVSSFILE